MRAAKPKAVRNPPKCGPMSRVIWSESRRRWQRVLTDEGRRFVSDWLIVHPRLLPLIAVCNPTSVHRASACGLSHDEIESICQHALVDATAMFDPQKPGAASFKTYLVYWMRSKIGDACRQHAAGVEYTEFSRTDIDLNWTARFEPGRYEISSYTGLQVKSIRANEPDQPEDTADYREIQERLRLAVMSIKNPRTRAMLVEKYSLDCGGDRSYLQMAEAHGLSRARVQQIVAKGIEELREILAQRYPLMAKGGES